jgi:hypothetical protein
MEGFGDEGAMEYVPVSMRKEAKKSVGGAGRCFWT